MSQPVARSPTLRANDGTRALKAARRTAEESQNQIRALLTLTDTALSYLALDDLLREVLGRVAAVMAVGQVAIFLLDEDGKTLTLRATRGLLEEAIGQAQVAAGKGFIDRIAATREPLILNKPSPRDIPVLHPLLHKQVRALAGVPLLVVDPMAALVEGTQMSRLLGCSPWAARLRVSSPRWTCNCCSAAPIASPWRLTMP